MRTTSPYLLLAALLAASGGGCASEEEKRPCPPGGIGVAEHEGKNVIEQIAEYKKYNCSKPQICPDQGGRAGTFPVAAASEPAEAPFLITNCSTGKEKLEITGVQVFGDERCFFTEVTDSDIKSKSILPGESTGVRTTYKPTQIGEDHAELRIFSNAENYPVLRLRVCGLAYKEGAEPEPGPQPGPTPDGGAGGPPDGGAQPDTIPALECKPAESQNGSCHK